VKDMSINIDVEKKLEENDLRIKEIKELLPSLRRQAGVLEKELENLTNVNLFLIEEKKKN
jgi:hypothetical protein